MSMLLRRSSRISKALTPLLHLSSKPKPRSTRNLPRPTKPEPEKTPETKSSNAVEISSEAQETFDDPFWLQIEHGRAVTNCRVYMKRARKLAKDLCHIFPNGNISVMEGRDDCFELMMEKPGAEETQTIWSGIDKGPPRYLKFPDLGKVVDLLKTELNIVGKPKSELNIAGKPESDPTIVAKHESEPL